MTSRAFVVERLNWPPAAQKKSKNFIRLPGATRVACFDDFAAAEADCRRREAEAQAGVNPFAFGGPALHYQTSLDDGRLRDWVMDAGLDPPKPGPDCWRVWWDRHSPAMSDLQKAKVWEALDKIRFFRVVEGSARVAFMAVRVHWAYNDEFFYRSADAVEPVRAFSTRDKAEEYCRQQERKLRVEYNPFDINGHEWECWTSLSQVEFRRRVEALGLETPAGPYDYVWCDWWDSRMTAAQRQGVWDLCDKAHFFEVTEVELPG